MPPVIIGTRQLVRTVSRGLGSPAAGAFRNAACSVRPNWYGVWDADDEHAIVLCASDQDTVIVRVAASTVWASTPFDAVVCWHRGVWWARVRTQDPHPMVCLDGAEAFGAVADAAAHWASRPTPPRPMVPRHTLYHVSLNRTAEDYMSCILFL